MKTLRAAAASAALTFAMSQTCSSPIVSGVMPITVDGTTESWAVAVSGSDTSGVTVSDGVLTMQHNYRAYFVPGCPQSFTPSAFQTRMPLLGKQLNFTVDLSSAGCGCNVAFYAVFMPAVNSSQQPDPTHCGDYYCDANDVCGVWCPEMDIMEANTAAMQVTPHACDQPTGYYYPSCDKSGCGMNTRTAGGAMAYGPNSSYTIDTSKPFVVSTSFVNGTAGLESITTTLSQGLTASVSFTHTDKQCGKSGNQGYLEALTQALQEGMVPTLSVWGDEASSMSWLDIPPCSTTQNCNAGAQMVLTHVTLTTLQ